mmetsp:Transcript_3070/g.14478  ORF Transcript_3070/g.14478 Transcript_3070/m.14478 type:complete len:120 (+) Transcript_3070:91-450(+)
MAGRSDDEYDYLFKGEDVRLSNNAQSFVNRNAFEPTSLFWGFRRGETKTYVLFVLLLLIRDRICSGADWGFRCGKVESSFQIHQKPVQLGIEDHNWCRVRDTEYRRRGQDDQGSDLGHG